jgi:integrase
MSAAALGLALRKHGDMSLRSLIAGAGKSAPLRFLEFFTVNIHNQNTRAADARAAGDFLRWWLGLRGDVRRMVRRRASEAGIETAIGCHTFLATGITDYLTNGGRIEDAERMAGHSNAKTTGLYDRRNDEISAGEVERIGI